MYSRAIYSSDEERLEARRETFRRSQAKRWAHYRELCEEAGIEPRTSKQGWAKHYLQVRPAMLPYEVENAALIERSLSEAHRWWLRRLSVRDICSIGRNLDFVSSEGVG